MKKKSETISFKKKSSKDRKSEEVKKEIKKAKKAKEENKEKNKKAILNFSFLTIVLFLIVCLILSGKWQTSEFYRDPKWIIICYALCLMLQIVIIHLFMMYPSYKLKYGGEVPKGFMHSMIIIILSIVPGIITRLVSNVFWVKLLAIAINVCILDIIFYRLENKSIKKIKRINIKEIMKQNAAKIIAEIFFTLLLTEMSFTNENIANFEMFIRNK